ncbi:hypothetical protein K458DRAFT_410151 [Lentithecium fluviatile CBS 122367]|uniref:Heterokaryon incompatibility domain-containing protein n=1 Tax=Lentithecium fluviatile CBS 122367 TaxID=1168545 RepID=A0A6G1IF16_9PLEO|nr:hypothetical protein K458DRAFT_410151 [Lentithecium fluviatile CBS 122367]
MYATLSLPKAGKPYPEPDYNAPVAEVYKQYAIEYIRRTGSLEWLNEASCRKHKVAETKGYWPSWVPDWEALVRNEIVLRNYGEVKDWYSASRLYNIFGRNPVNEARQQDETDKTDEATVKGAGTAQEAQAITKDFEDKDAFGIIDPYRSIIRPPGILCDTISKVASLLVLSMDYSQINRFAEQEQEHWTRGYYPKGLPIFNVFYKMSLMGIYPVNMGLSSVFPITKSDFTNDLARGFLLQVACDFGYLYDIPWESSGLSAEGGWGRANVARYERTTPRKRVDSRFWDLDTVRIAEKGDLGMSDCSASRAEDHEEFATFQSFIEARKKDDFETRVAHYWFLVHHWRTRVRDATAGRTLFLTKHGLIGLATNPYIKQGDLVTVLYGRKTPFILRHMESRIDASVQKLLNDAYTYGQMEGEAFTQASRWKHDGTGATYEGAGAMNAEYEVGAFILTAPPRSHPSGNLGQTVSSS